MPLLRILLTTLALCACTATALAQTAPAADALQHAMTAEEFKAAGLGKLSPAELASLNAWLDRKIDAETTHAATQAQEKMQSEVRGFFNFGSLEPIESSIAGEFRGFARGRSYILANGQEWEQVDDASLAGVRKTDPPVRITPSKIGNAWYMAIEGYNTRAKVRRVK